jgi:hypothetical protein
MGLTMGVNNLIEIFDEKYYRHMSGGILEAFGKLFYRDLKVFLYPMEEADGTIIDSQNLKVHPRMKELYKFFAYNGKVVDIEGVDSRNLKIFSREVLKQIANGQTGWEHMLPSGIDEIIKEHHLFGFERHKMIES